MYVPPKILALALGLVLVVAATAGWLYVELAQANADLRTARVDVRQTTDALDASRGDNARLSRLLAEANSTAVALNEEVAAANTRLAEADAGLVAANADIEKGNESIVNLQRVIDQSERSIADLTDATQQWERDYGTLQSDLSDLEEAYENRNAQWIATRLQLARAHVDLRNATEQLAAARELLAEFEAAGRLARLTEPPLDEERTIILPLGGETKLSITRDVPGQASTMDLLERSVRVIEDFMGIPFPVDHVDLRFFSDVEDCGGYLGQFKYTHMVSCVHENDDSPAEVLRIIARETARYYWNSRQWDSRPRNPRWASGGAADFLEYIVQANLSPDYDRRGPCTLDADSIVEFLELPLPTSSDIDDEYRQAHHDCRHGLGERLFHALYHGTDDATFRAAFRDFYQHLQGSPSASIRDALRDAFAAHATPDQLAEVDRILEERYGPRPN